MRYGILALEAQQDQPSETPAVDGDPAADDTTTGEQGQDTLTGGEDTTSGGQSDDATDEADGDKPIELPDVQELEIMRVDAMDEDKERREKTDDLRIVLDDGKVLMQHLDTALEHFQNAVVGRKAGTLRLAQEELAVAQDMAGALYPNVIDIPQTDQLSDENLELAMESLGSTVTSVVKAIIEALLKALELLKRFLRDVWRQLRALDSAIRIRGQELLQLRKGNEKRLLKRYEVMGVQLDQFVSISSNHKRSLSLGEIAAGEERPWRMEFERLAQLMATARQYEQHVSMMSDGFTALLDMLADSADGKLANADVDKCFRGAGLPIKFMPHAQQGWAKHAHGENATDLTDLKVSEEYLGNFFQVGHEPNAHMLSLQPSLVQQWAVCKIGYVTDASAPMANDFMPQLSLAQLPSSLQACAAMGQELITAQRSSERVEIQLEKLSFVVKRAGQMVWQSAQGDAVARAEKHRQLIAVVQAISTIEGNCTNFFMQGIKHVRQVQQAWLVYLDASLKREREILNAPIKA